MIGGATESRNPCFVIESGEVRIYTRTNGTFWVVFADGKEFWKNYDTGRIHESNSPPDARD
jgi:hypothetical protein